MRQAYSYHFKAWLRDHRAIGITTAIPEGQRTGADILQRPDARISGEETRSEMITFILLIVLTAALFIVFAAWLAEQRKPK